MNWLEPQIHVVPTFDPVELDTLKAHLEVDIDYWDDLLGGYLDAAVGHIEAFTGLRLATQTVKLRADGFAAGRFKMPLPPLQSVTSIEYVDSAGATQTLATSVYSVLPYGLSPLIELKREQSWPSTDTRSDAVTITAVVGYGQGALPPAVQQAVLLTCGDWFRNRENTNIGNIVNELPIAVQALLANYRVYSL